MTEDQFYQRFDKLVLTLAGHLQSPQYSEIAWKNVRTYITEALLETAAELQAMKAGTDCADEIREFRHG